MINPRELVKMRVVCKVWKQEVDNFYRRKVKTVHHEYKYSIPVKTFPSLESTNCLHTKNVLHMEIYFLKLLTANQKCTV